MVYLIAACTHEQFFSYVARVHTDTNTHRSSYFVGGCYRHLAGLLIIFTTSAAAKEAGRSSVEEKIFFTLPFPADASILHCVCVLTQDLTVDLFFLFFYFY